jgi:hypothetical protein
LERDAPSPSDSKSPKFKLWCDLDELAPDEYDIDNDHCDIVATLETGEVYPMKVWTYAYLKTAVEEDRASGDHLRGKYQPAPDLFVERLDRELLRQAVADMLASDEVEFEKFAPGEGPDDEDFDEDDDDEDFEDGDEDDDEDEDDK